MTQQIPRFLGIFLIFGHNQNVKKTPIPSGAHFPQSNTSHLNNSQNNYCQRAQLWHLHMDTTNTPTAVSEADREEIIDLGTDTKT